MSGSSTAAARTDPSAAARTDPNARRAWRLVGRRGVSLTTRILVVNVLALALLAGSFFFLDSYRTQLIGERFRLARAEAEIAAAALDGQSLAHQRMLLARIGPIQHLRLRLYDAGGRLLADSFALAPPAFVLGDPARDPWYLRAARGLDRAVDFVVGAPDVESYHEPVNPSANAWPEAIEARATRQSEVRWRYAPDRTPMLTAATPVGSTDEILLSLRNARDVTQAVRDARQTLGIIIALALFFSIQLSLFLARTIVQPLRALVRTAVRVRLGRGREVVVPRLPGRSDEIGLLARAFSDMTTALRQRIDAVESFAADVSHELKNPLASLASALETMGKVDAPELRRQLLDIATHDVRRIDRLISEIADASRIDAELSRATFTRLDLAELAAQVVGARAQRGESAIRCRLPERWSLRPIVRGDALRLERVLENLLDNAVSFSPAGGEVEVTVWAQEDIAGSRVHLMVCDQGPGIPPTERTKVFERFHSVRPAEEDFGAHSGLGLAIARTIAEAHDGTLTINDRPDGVPGACLTLSLPYAGDEAA